MHTESPATGGPPTVGPWVASAEVLALSAAAHASAGGELPTPDRLLAIWLVAAAACLALRHRLLPLTGAAALATAGQVIVHLVGSDSGHAGHQPAASGPFDEMLLAHAMSAAATVLVLLWQDQALLALTGLLVPVKVSRTRPPAPPARPCAEHRRRPLVTHDVDVAPRRGPPREPAFAAS